MAIFIDLEEERTKRDEPKSLVYVLPKGSYELPISDPIISPSSKKDGLESRLDAKNDNWQIVALPKTDYRNMSIDYAIKDSFYPGRAHLSPYTGNVVSLPFSYRR